MNQGNLHFVLTIKRNLEVTGSRKLRVSLSFVLAIDPFKDTIVDCMCTENYTFQDQIQGVSIEWGHSVKKNCVIIIVNIIDLSIFKNP